MDPVRLNQLELRMFVKDPMDFMSLTHEINAAITRALYDAGIEIPFPQRDIHVRSMTSTADEIGQ